MEKFIIVVLCFYIFFITLPFRRSPSLDLRTCHVHSLLHEHQPQTRIQPISWLSWEPNWFMKLNLIKENFQLHWNWLSHSIPVSKTSPTFHPHHTINESLASSHANLLPFLVWYTSIICGCHWCNTSKLLSLRLEFSDFFLHTNFLHSLIYFISIFISFRTAKNKK